MPLAVDVKCIGRSIAEKSREKATLTKMLDGTQHIGRRVISLRAFYISGSKSLIIDDKFHSFWVL